MRKHTKRRVYATRKYRKGTSYSIQNPFDAIINGFVLIVESILRIFGGDKPYLYKNNQNKVVDLQSISDTEMSIDEKIVYDRSKIESDWEDIGKDFESFMGLYPGSPTWKKMASGRIPKSQEFEEKYTRYEKEVSEKIIANIKNHPSLNNLEEESWVILDRKDFKEFIDIISKFEKLVRSLDDKELTKLIKLRLMYGSNYSTFLKFIEKNQIEDDSLYKFHLIYVNLFRCLDLGYPEVLKAFEIDLAGTAVRLRVENSFGGPPELTQDDYFLMLTIDKDKFKDIMSEKIEVIKLDTDSNGETIYY